MALKNLNQHVSCVAVYALGFYVDAHAARRELGKEFGCLPPVSLEHNQALAERAHTPQNLLLPPVFSHPSFQLHVGKKRHQIHTGDCFVVQSHCCTHVWP
jgi:hypothetical protein